MRMVIGGWMDLDMVECMAARGQKKGDWYVPRHCPAQLTGYQSPRVREIDLRGERVPKIVVIRHAMSA